MVRIGHPCHRFEYCCVLLKKLWEVLWLVLGPSPGALAYHAECPQIEICFDLVTGKLSLPTANGSPTLFRAGEGLGGKGIGDGHHPSYAVSIETVGPYQQLPLWPTGCEPSFSSPPPPRHAPVSTRALARILKLPVTSERVPVQNGLTLFKMG